MGSELLSQLGLATGVASASGVRLYATVAALGILDRAGALQLPVALESLAQPPIIALALLLCLVEFVADKVPAFDSLWDTFQTFIRIPAGAILGFALLGDVEEPWRTAAALLCGTVALSAHAIKASSRLVINSSPEPFSNWMASLSEDAFVLVLLWLLISHPVIALALAFAVLVAGILLVGWIARMVGRRRSRTSVS